MRTLRKDIQGLRAIAVLSVIFFHANKDLLPGGFVGVDVFFVISGYLIGSIIIEQKERETFSFPQFYFSRIKRIVPAYCVVLALSALFFSVWLIPEDYARFLDSLKSAFIFTSNRFFSRQADYFAPEGYETPLIHTWSLAVEMQFYLFLPVLLVFLPTRVLRPTIFFLILGGVCYSAYNLSNGARQLEYYSLISRVPEFLLGCLLAVLPAWKSSRVAQRESLAILGLCLIAASFLLINEKSPFPGWLALFPTLGAMMIIATERGAVSSILSIPPLVWVGDLSYSLYLWHWPVLAGLRYYSESYYLKGGEIVLFALLTVGLSVLSFRYVESPFHGRKIDIRRVGRPAFLAVSVGAAVWAAAWINRGLVPPLAVALTRYAAQEEICHEKIIGECLRGDLSSKRSILMVGDSHAAQLNHFADEIGREAGVSIRVITASSCVTIPRFDWDRIPDWAQGTCKRHIDYAEQYLREVDTIIIAGMWQYHVNSQKFTAALEGYIRSATANNQKVILLAQIPMLSNNVQRAHRFESLGIRLHNASNHPEWQAANEVVKKIVSGIPNTRFVDFSNLEIFSSPPFYQSELIYLDDSHLNEIGVRLLGKHAVHEIAELLTEDRKSSPGASDLVR